MNYKNKLLLEKEILRQLTLMGIPSSKTLLEQPRFSLGIPLLFEQEEEKIPSLPKTTAGIKSFQDWMDTKGPWVKDGSSYKKLEKGVGYGTSGSNTESAWKVYGQEYTNELLTKVPSIDSLKKMINPSSTKDIYGKNSTVCPSGYAPLSSNEIKSFEEMSIDPRFDTRQHTQNYVQAKDGTWCKKNQPTEELDMELVANEFSEFINDIAPYLHVILTIGSIIAALFIPGGQGYAIVALLEVTDALVYFNQGNDWMGYLALIFAFLPIGWFMKYMPAFYKLTAKGVTKLFDKLLKGASKEGLERVEREAIEELSEKLSNKTVQKELMREIVKQAIRLRLKSTTAGKLVYWVVKCVRMGWMGTEFLAEVFGVIYGVWYTWGQVAAKLGILTEEEKAALKNVKKVDNNVEPGNQFNLSKFIDGVFQASAATNKSYSVDNKGTYDIIVLFIQLFLKDVVKGSDVKTTVLLNKDKLELKNNVFIKKITIVNAFGTVIKTINTQGLKDSTITLWTKQNEPSDGVLIAIIEDVTGKKTKQKFFKTTLSSSVYNYANIGTSVKWGYFDESTKQLVMSYQSKKGLTVDGIVDKDVFEKMASEISSNTFLSNVSDKTITSNDIDSLKSKFSANMETEDEITDEKLKQEIDTIIVTNQEEIVDSLTNAFESTMDLSDSTEIEKLLLQIDGLDK